MPLKDNSSTRTNEVHLHAKIAGIEAEKRGMQLEIERLLAAGDIAATKRVRQAQIELETTLRNCRAIRAGIKQTSNCHIGKQERGRKTASAAIIQPIGGDAELGLSSSYQRTRDSIAYILSQYEDLCREERAIEDMVERELERRERVVREELESAELELEYTQRMAEEAIVAMEEANGWDPGFRPLAQLGAGYTNDTVVEVPGTRLKPVSVNAVHLEQPSETLVLPSATDPPIAMQMPSAYHFSIPTFPTSFVSPVINPSSFVHLPTIAPSNVVPPIHPSFTKLQVSIFEKYERMVGIALTSGSNLIIPQVPWPIFTHARSTYPTTDLTKKVFKPDAINHFFRMYICWKGWDLRVGRDALLQDWIFLLNQIPQSKPGGHRAASKTVAALRTLV